MIRALAELNAIAWAHNYELYHVLTNYSLMLRRWCVYSILKLQLALLNKGAGFTNTNYYILLVTPE